VTEEEYEDLLADLGTAERDLESAEEAELDGRVTDREVHGRTLRVLRERVQTLRQESEVALRELERED